MFPCQGLEGGSAQRACTAWMAMKSYCTHHSWLSCSLLFVMRAAGCSAAQVGLHQSPLPSHLKSKGGCRSACSGGTKPDSTCYTLLSLPYNTLSTNAPIKQARLRSSTRSLIECGVELLGNLNKVYRAHFAWPTL